MIRFIAILIFSLDLCFSQDTECRNIDKVILCDEFNDFDNEWEGDISKFKIKNGILTLKDSLNNEVYISNKYLQILPDGEIKWRFDLELNFNPSMSNVVDVYLIADDKNPKNCKNGFFLKIGNADDYIRFGKKKDGHNVYLLSSEKKILNNPSNKLEIEVLVDKDHNWHLDFILNDTVFFSERVNEKLFIREGYFSFACKYNRVGYKGGISLDNLYVQSLDFIEPRVQKVEIKDLNTIEITFSEEIKKSSCLDVTNYTLKNFGNPNSVIYDKNVVNIIYDDMMIDEGTFELEIKNLEDLSGNKMEDYNEKKIVEKPRKYRIKITEFMPNPHPTVYLPNVEYIEIYNDEDFVVDVCNWSINISGRKILIDENFKIDPKSYLLIIGDTNYYNLFSKDINKIVLEKFTDIPNISGVKINYIAIYNELNQKIDLVTYDRFFLEDKKSNGGWSLERIDLENDCVKDNWQFSNDNKGGSPGRKNSVNKNLEKTPKDFFVRELGMLEDKKTLRILFSEMLNESEIYNFLNYQITPSQSISSIYYDANILNEIFIKFEGEITSGEVYEIEILEDIKSCEGREISKNKFYFGITEYPKKEELIINEVLYNPYDGGEKFIEIYNNSRRYLNLNDIKLCIVRKGEIYSEIPVCNHMIEPDKYVFFTKNIGKVGDFYSYGSDTFFELDKMLNMSISSDRIAIIAKNLNIIDEMVYNDSMHFDLISRDNTKGISLERIDFDGLSLSKNNWTSASSSVNYATPGFKNSQAKDNDNIYNEELKIENETFVVSNGEPRKPLEIKYKFDKNIIATVKIFNDRGFLISTILDNEYLSHTGSFFWNGSTDDKVKLCSGIYLLVLEGYSEDGKVHNIRKIFVVGNVD